jgi:acetyl esterase/lipase
MNYHVVSVAYRFLPEVQMPGIFDDITDALAWCRSNLPSILGADDIDIDAYVAAGDSAGGTLSSLCGALLRPRPRVVIDVFGVTDMTDPFFYAKLSPERLALPYLQDLEPRDREEQKRSLASRDESKAEFICPWDWELEPNMSEDDLRIFWGTPDFKVEPKHRYRMDLNKYLNREGERLPLLLMQRERYDDEEAFFADVRKRWSAFHMADETYPPTFILHGDADNAVPVEQSYRFEKRLKELSVPVQAVYCPGGEHCFENKIEVSLRLAGWM